MQWKYWYFIPNTFYIILSIAWHQVWPPEISNYGAICLESRVYFHNATSPACIFTGTAIDYVFPAKSAKYSNIQPRHQDLRFPSLFIRPQIKLEMAKCLQISLHKFTDGASINLWTSLNLWTSINLTSSPTWWQVDSPHKWANNAETVFMPWRRHEQIQLSSMCIFILMCGISYVAVLKDVQITPLSNWGRKKWRTFSRCLIHTHFLEWKLIYFFHWHLFFVGPNDNDSALVPWGRTKNDLVNRYIFLITRSRWVIP